MKAADRIAVARSLSRLKPPHKSELRRGSLRVLRGNSGDTFGDTLYRTSVQLSATSYKMMVCYKYMIIMYFCNILQLYATQCKMPEIGL